jgi:exodeoxyribonuclease VII small subunit
MKASPKPIDKLSYEQALKDLGIITDKLENDSPALEESMKLFERGQALALHCAKLLENAELRVQQLTEQGDFTSDQEDDTEK